LSLNAHLAKPFRYLPADPVRASWPDCGLEWVRDESRHAASRSRRLEKEKDMNKILRARPRFKVAVALLMTMVVSVSALAASPFQAFQAEAVITGIDTGTVKAAGPLRWNVKDRTVSGTFTDGEIGPDGRTTDDRLTGALL
jgi:hypothetical protein